MTMKNDRKRGDGEFGRRSNPNERGRSVDTNRDGDSQRNRTDDDLYGADEY